MQDNNFLENKSCKTKQCLKESDHRKYLINKYFRSASVDNKKIAKEFNESRRSKQRI